MMLQPIVEGHGEVTAVPELLRRLQAVAESYELQIGAPIRKKRAELVVEALLKNAILLARKQEGCKAILVLLDSDDDCPKVKAAELKPWAAEAAAPIPCEVVLSQREYEAWFLAAIESLRGVRGVRADPTSHPNPEEPRGAKEQLEQRLEVGRSYSETADQVALTSRVDLPTVHRRCRSFRQLVKAFGSLHRQPGLSFPNVWPPADWHDEA